MSLLKIKMGLYIKGPLETPSSYIIRYSLYIVPIVVQHFYKVSDEIKENVIKSITGEAVTNTMKIIARIEEVFAALELKES